MLLKNSELYSIELHVHHACMHIYSFNFALIEKDLLKIPKLINLHRTLHVFWSIDPCIFTGLLVCTVLSSWSSSSLWSSYFSSSFPLSPLPPSPPPSLSLSPSPPLSPSLLPWCLPAAQAGPIGTRGDCPCLLQDLGEHVHVYVTYTHAETRVRMHVRARARPHGPSAGADGGTALWPG